MKLFFSIFLSLAISSTYASNLFLYETYSPVEITEVVDNKVIELPFIVGKTFSIKNSLSIKSTNIVTYMFPHRVAISHNDNTSVYFTDNNTEYDNDFSVPNIVKVKNSSLIASVSGECYLINDSENMVIVGTPMANIQVNNANVFIKSGEKYTHVYVIKGKVTVFDARSKKKKELNEGDYLVITPQISMNPRDAKVTISGNSFSVKEVDDDEKLHHSNQTANLQSKIDNVTFVHYNKEIFGFKLK